METRNFKVSKNRLRFDDLSPFRIFRFNGYGRLYCKIGPRIIECMCCGSEAVVKKNYNVTVEIPVEDRGSFPLDE